MRIYVINLARAKARLQHMQEQMSRLGLDFIRVEAVDGQQLAPSRLTELQLAEQRTGGVVLCQSLSEVACNLSHAKALEFIAKGEDEYGVVLEDDVVLSEHMRQLLSDISWIPAGSDIVKIDHGSRKVLLRRVCRLDNNYELCKRLTSDYMAAGYIISKDAARRLYPLLYKTPLLVDMWYYSFELGIAKQLRAWQLYPACVTPHSAIESQIEHPKRFRYIWNKKIIAYTIKRLRSKRFVQRWLRPNRYRWGRVPFL